MISLNLSIFFDTNGLATTHTINGTAGVVCIVGDKTTAVSEIDGMSLEFFDLAIKAADLPNPTPKQAVSIDGVRWVIDSNKSDGLIHVLTLTRPIT